MNKILLLISTLLLGTSGALLWILSEMELTNGILLHEPNPVILVAEMAPLTAILAVSIFGILVAWDKLRGNNE